MDLGRPADVRFPGVLVGNGRYVQATTPLRTDPRKDVSICLASSGMVLLVFCLLFFLVAELELVQAVEQPTQFQ